MLGNLLEDVLENNNNEKEINKFLISMSKYKEEHPILTIPPNPSIFSKEALSARPGMEWLHATEMILFYPDNTQVGSQRDQLDTLKEQLKLEGIQLTKGFCPAFHETYTQEPLLALDTETTGLDTRTLYDYEGNLTPKVELVGICLAANENKGYYLPIKHTGEDGILNWDLQTIILFLNNLHQEFTILYHNAQYDREVLALNGVTQFRPWPYFFDTQILDYFYDVNNKAHGLKGASEKLLSRKMLSINELFIESGIYKAAQLKNITITFDSLPAANASTYAISDALSTFGLFKFYASIPQEKNMFFKESVPLTIDHKNSDVLRNLYRTGLPVNFEYFLYAAKDTLFRRYNLEQEIFRYIGRNFDIGSPAQLSKLLFEEYNIPVLSWMKRGKPTKNNPQGLYSTAEDVLEELNKKFPEYLILKYVVQLRKLGATLGKIFIKCIINSYVDALIPNTRVHLAYSQTVIPTGRLSSSSNKSRERVVVKQSGKTQRVSYRYDKGSWSAGLNSQGINNPRYQLAKAKRITAINEEQAGVNLTNPYPLFIRDELIKNSATI